MGPASDSALEAKLRRFMLAAAWAIFALSPVELLLGEHTGSPVQWLPFVAAGLGLLGCVLATFKPRRAGLKGARVLWLLIIGVSVFGVWEHLEHNLGFEQEIRPNASGGEHLWAALFGASPLLAPGILALGAFLALAACYRHPLLRKVGGPAANT